MNKETLYYHKNSDVVAFKRVEFPNGDWCERTYDECSNELFYIKSDGYWCKRTYDKHGNITTHKDSKPTWYERTFDDQGNILTHRDRSGYWCEYTYDEYGEPLTCRTQYTHEIKGKLVTKEELEEQLRTINFE